VTLEKSAYAAWRSKDAKFWDTFLPDKFVGWGTSGKLDKVSAKKEYSGAGSYGTRAAQVYIRQYPQSVRTAYLGSPVPIDVAEPLDFARTEQTALDHVFENCAAEAACHAAFPNLRSEFQRLVRRLDVGETRVHVPEAADAVVLSRGRVAEWVRSQLYRPHDAAAVPWFLHRAYVGDWSPILDNMLSHARDVEQELGFGLFLSITCSEDLPFVQEKDVVVATHGTFLGDYRLRQQQAACKLWPRAKLPKGYRLSVKVKRCNTVRYGRSRWRHSALVHRSGGARILQSNHSRDSWAGAHRMERVRCRKV
jgi:hypothetical protein